MVTLGCCCSGWFAWRRLVLFVIFTIIVHALDECIRWQSILYDICEDAWTSSYSWCEGVYYIIATRKKSTLTTWFESLQLIDSDSSTRIAVSGNPIIQWLSAIWNWNYDKRKKKVIYWTLRHSARLLPENGHQQVVKIPSLKLSTKYIPIISQHTVC